MKDDSQIQEDSTVAWLTFFREHGAELTAVGVSEGLQQSIFTAGYVVGWGAGNRTAWNAAKATIDKVTK